MVLQPVHADTGPKPSLTVTVRGLEERGDYYIAIFASTESYGPYSLGDEWSNDDVHKVFTEYQDPDGYYYLGMSTTSASGNSIHIGYWPPENFKVVVYVVAEKLYISSAPAERSVFDTEMLFTVEGDHGTLEDISSMENQLLYGAACMAATVIIETLLALLFGYKDKLVPIIITNIITNSLLHLLLAVADYTSGLLVFYIFYVILEVAVLIIEFVVYCFAVKGNKLKLFVYTLLANVITFFVGFYLKAIWWM